MSNKPDGGPAFPTLKRLEGTSAGVQTAVSSQGMSMRDYLAAMAIQGLMVGGTKGDSLESLADLSYRIADEMIKRRES